MILFDTRHSFFEVFEQSPISVMLTWISPGAWEVMRREKIIDPKDQYWSLGLSSEHGTVYARLLGLEVSVWLTKL